MEKSASLKVAKNNDTYLAVFRGKTGDDEKFWQ
jgi:hypothetical protein